MKTCIISFVIGCVFIHYLYITRVFGLENISINDTVQTALYEKKATRNSTFLKFVKNLNFSMANVEPDSPENSWFDKSKLNNFIIMVTLSAIVLYFIRHARNGAEIKLRKIKGLEAVEEAIGRAAEMGKPVLFVHGLASMGSISTIAAVNILGRIAKRVAEYDTTLKVVNNDPIVMSVSQEVVKEAFLEAGRPDSYMEENTFLVAAEQFPYVAAVSGIMNRERPAANFYMGYFYAESLLLAETGAGTGAIQIAGTDSYTQLPFFITTCDYTLMGEELYAASAYLSKEPLLLGSLRAQDIGKAILIVILVAGTALATFGITFITRIFSAS